MNDNKMQSFVEKCNSLSKLNLKNTFLKNCSGLQMSFLGGGKWLTHKALSPFKDWSLPNILVINSEHPLTGLLSVLTKPVKSRIVDRSKCKLKGWDASLDIWSPRN